MPRYDYKCSKCEAEFYLQHPIAEHRPTEICPHCGETSDQVFQVAPSYNIQGLPKDRFNDRKDL